MTTAQGGLTLERRVCAHRVLPSQRVSARPLWLPLTDALPPAETIATAPP
jgi:hypothetical protein